MSNPTSLQELAQLEPWRLGKGQPRNALDPTWEPGVLNNPCDGEIDWEGSTDWWVCTKCGYVGSAHYTRHRPIQTPGFYFLHSILFFLNKRTHDPPKVAPERVAEEVIKQMLFVAGVALRYAATLPAGDLGKYADRLVVD
jgi:hypothetical protein